MTDLAHSKQSWDEIEQLVRAAGHYVQPSFDLRPRVLEAAREQRSERRARKYIRRMACAVFFLFWALHVADRDDGAERARGLFSEVGAVPSASGGWEMV